MAGKLQVVAMAIPAVAVDTAVILKLSSGMIVFVPH
jgi:hypothetical protein